MVFVGGPRQVGKTTLAKKILDGKSGYLSWDIPTDKERILRQEWPHTSLWVFDEIHKYKSWRNMLKGLYDQFQGRKKILVTGSASLDYYRHGGDSLQGRYHHFRLFPLSVAELKIKNKKGLLDLLNLGGFPEPFFEGSQVEAKRWSSEYRHRLINEELTTLEHVVDMGKLELLSLRLPMLVGNPLSLNALREDLEVNHQTLSRWVEILERIYSIIRVPPFGAPRLRAVKKERKHYHLDWTLVPDMAMRFENLVAIHLLKWVYYEQDTKGRELELRYFRDVDGREVDFVITENLKPIQIIECKWADAGINAALNYFKTRFPSCEAWQISATGAKDYESTEGIRVTPACTFLAELI